MRLLAALAARLAFAKGLWSRPLRYGAPVVVLALLQGCAVDPQRELLGGGTLFLQDALQAYVRAQVPGSLNITFLTSQLWQNSQAILFRYDTVDPQGRQLQHLGLAFAEPAGLVGWRVRRILTVVRRPAALAPPIERYTGRGMLPGSLRSYTRVAGRVHLGGGRRVLISYADGEDVLRDLIDGYFLDLHEGPARVTAIQVFDASGQPIGKPSR